MRYLTIFFCAILVLFSLQQTQARIIHVPADSSTIQGGIDGAVNGDTVLVAPGTYYEHINFHGKAIVVTSEKGADSTIISRVYDGVSMVTFDSGEDTTSILDGFTVTGGQSVHVGAGINCVNSSPKIRNNIIVGNSATFKGSGLHCGGGHPVLEANLIANNAGDGGGGAMHLYDCGAIVRNNVIRENFSYEHGGGIFLQQCNQTTVEGNLLLANSTSNVGGGILVSAGDNNVLINNTIADNASSSGQGGGVCIWYSDSTVVLNNIVVGSPAGYGIYSSNSHNSVIEYNDVWENSPADYEGTTPGEGCISADPLFCDPENNNYYFHTASPCHGTGQGGADIGAFGVGCGGVLVTPGNDKVGPPNSEVAVVFFIQNIGPESDTFDLGVSDTLGWEIMPTYEEMSLESGQQDSILITVSIPLVDVGTTDLITLVATSQTDSLSWHKASLRVTVRGKIIKVPFEFPTIQEAIDAARTGDTVLVAKGNYYEKVDFLGKAILVASDFIFDNETTTIESTIIDADTSVVGISDTGSAVIFVSGEDSTSVIKGFTIQNGIGTLNPLDNRSGGGIHCFNSSPTISHNVITNNSANQGGGIFCDSCSPIIQNNIIFDDSAHLGGGIRCWYSSPVINSNTMNSNRASDGGAISCDESSSPTITNNVITGNCADYGGGIVCGRNCLPAISSNTITGNSASLVGGGIFLDWNSSPTITNNIISNSLDGEGIYCGDESWPTISYNDTWDNADGNFFGCPGVGDTTWGTNFNGTPCDSFYNIIQDPMFVDPVSDFHLQVGSPCIDAGDNYAPSLPETDFDGNPRIIDGNQDDIAVVDMGAFEYRHICHSIDVPADYPTVQEAIDAAWDCDTVLVARGHYYERIDFIGKAILVASNFIFDNDTTSIDSTIIDGGGSGSVVVFSASEDLGSTIQGFTITNGNAYNGGGIHCDGSSPTIINNIVVGNSALESGGGIWCSSSPAISCNTIIDNSAYRGGGIACDLFSATISGNTITDNSGMYGGGIHCYESSPTITNNGMTGNLADSGGAVCCWNLSSPAITNNTITENSASAGGGISCFWYSHPSISNNIISNSRDGEGIASFFESFPAISYNDTWDNADGNFFGCPGVGDTTWGTNFNGTPCDSFYNIIRDPLFADTINFKLLCNSPCVDAGDPSIYVPPDSGGCRIDMGKHEYVYMLGDANGDFVIDMGDVIFLITYSFLGTSLPCPYRAGDVNGDEMVDIGDVVYLINYLFLGTSPPVCP